MVVRMAEIGGEELETAELRLNYWMSMETPLRVGADVDNFPRRRRRRDELETSVALKNMNKK